MVVTDDADVADLAASYVNHGRGSDGTYAHERVGHNFRMTSMAAAIGRVQLEKLPEWVRSRRENAERLTAGLSAVPGVVPPEELDAAGHAYHQYTVRCEDRDHLEAALENDGIGSGVYYPTPIHRLEAYDGFDVAAPVAERAASEVLSLPVHPGVEAADVDRIVAATGAVQRHHPQ